MAEGLDSWNGDGILHWRSVVLVAGVVVVVKK